MTVSADPAQQAKDETSVQDPYRATVLSVPAPHLPFMMGRLAHPPGLMPMPPEAWLRLDPDHAAQMAMRDGLMAADPAMIVAESLGEAAPAATELLALVLATLPERPGYQVRETQVVRPYGVRVAIDPARPFATLARLVADDLCLLVPDAASAEYRLAGAALCFPSRWSLAEKMGRPMTAIHEPVPDYDAVLARRVNRVFEALHEDRPVMRYNWLVHDDPTLCQPTVEETKRHGTSGIDGPYYLRTERQTLRRLPETGAIVFGIKTSVTPVEALAPDEAQALADALGALSTASVAYRMGAGPMAAARRQLYARATE
ncbi:MAG: DUF3445 domain-containing protein [Pseudomonadota bacterium]